MEVELTEKNIKNNKNEYHLIKDTSNKEKISPRNFNQDGQQNSKLDEKNKLLTILYIFFILFLFLTFNIGFPNIKKFPEEKEETIKSPTQLTFSKTISIEWVLNLIENMKDINKTKTKKEKYLDKENLIKLITTAKDIFSEYKESLLDISTQEGNNFTIVGDIHGQFYDLLHIFEINGYPSEKNIYLFNGDFVDRGIFGFECITTLLAFKILYPKNFFMSRGNHEDIKINKRYGFKSEILEKYDEEVYEHFHDLFKYLPLGHVLNKQVLVIHGGLFSNETVNLEELKKIDRIRDIPYKGVMCELLWSDPMEKNGKVRSPRGAGILFGPDVTEKFLKDNNLTLLIRSHEVRMNGYQIEPGGKVITVFSAPNYVDRMGNKGGLIKFIGNDMKPNFIQFDASPHP